MEDEDGHQWKVVTHSSRCYGGLPTTRYDHDIVIEEVDPATLVSVDFEGISLTPRRWRFNDPGAPGPMFIDFIADLDDRQQQEFEQVLEQRTVNGGGYFPVTMVGIRANAESMRFGPCYWQPSDANVTRNLICLVAEEGDYHNVVFVTHDEMRRHRRVGTETKSLVDALVDELRSSGVLDDGALDRIRSTTAARTYAVGRRYERTDAIDPLFES